MSQIKNPFKNPFVRGYRNLRVERTLMITFEDDCPPIWRPLHPSQAHLSDDQIALFSCLFGKDFVLVSEGQDVPDDLEVQCPNEGLVRTVVYALIGDEVDGQAIHVGDLYSEESARETVHRLSFETGLYSRCWEISSAHLCNESNDYLAELAEGDTPACLPFVAFRIPCYPAIGVKLFATPWTNANLMSEEGLTARQLRDEFREKGVPGDLVRVLELAGQADVRLLIFDDDATVLEGLPVIAA